MSLQEKEAYDLAKCKLAEYLQDSAVCSMDEYVQHGTTSTLQHIITTHMWPLTLRFVPRSREAVLVCMADKYCSTLETVVGFFHAAAALLRRKQV